MNVRTCPNCGEHNSAEAWNCNNCGETLSLDTLTELQDADVGPQNLVESSSPQSLEPTPQPPVEVQELPQASGSSIEQDLSGAQEEQSASTSQTQQNIGQEHAERKAAGFFESVSPVHLEFTTKATLEQVRITVLEALRNEGADVRSDTANQVVAGFGSGTKARLMGATLGGIKVMPRDLFVDFYREGGKTLVRLVVHDTFGFGARIGVADSLKDLMQQNAAMIMSAFPDAFPMQLESKNIPTQYPPSHSQGAEDSIDPIGTRQPSAALTDPKSLPNYSPYAVTSSRPPKDRSIALILEILPGIFGLLGFGWIYSGRTSTGLSWLIGFLVWGFFAILLLAISGGLACICILPINLVVIALSARSLEAYTKGQPELFGV